MFGSKAYIFAIISGILLGMSWNSLIPFTLFIAFIPLFFIFQNETYHYRQIFIFTLISFIFYHLGTVWWLSLSSLWGAILIILSNSLVMALVWAFAYRIRQMSGLILGLISLVTFWISFEYIHYHWELSWPFMNLGNWLGQIPKWIQWYEYTGVLGGTLWILLVNLMLFVALSSYFRGVKKRFVGYTIISFVLIIIPIIISHIIYKNYDERGEKAYFLIIQPNIEPYTEKYNAQLFEKQINTQIQLAHNTVSKRIDCVVFPESSFPVYLNEEKIPENLFLNKITKELNDSLSIAVLGGLYSYKLNQSDTFFYNTAFLSTRDNIPQLYHKSQLVVGVEKIPYEKYFSFLKNINVDFGGYNSSLSIDQFRKVFQIPDKNIKIAPVICYESVYGNFVGNFVKNGANSIAVITNDAWWGNTPGYKQHLMHSQLRAIECRRSVVRSANTGISCFINQKGEVFSQADAWREKTLSGSIFLNERLTFYTRNGDFVGKIVLFLSGLFLLICIGYIIKQKSNKTSNEK